MKNKLIYIIAVCLAYVGVGCTKQDTPLFQEKDGVFFSNSLTTYSFKDYVGVNVDTVYMAVSVFGDSSNVDRTVDVKVVEIDTILLANPDRYRILSGVIPAGKFEGKVAIEINNGPELADTIYSVFFEIVPNEDFPNLVEFKITRSKLEISDVPIKPSNWQYLELFYGVGPYEEEWWEFIKTTTGKSSFPWDPFDDEPEMSSTDVRICLIAVKNALKEHEYKTGEKLCYKNGDPWQITGV